MAKQKYTEAFDKFWSAYPRKTAKTVAFKAWLKQGIDGDAFLPLQILQDVEKRSRLKWWPKDHSKIPHGATWINQARWEDEGWEDEIKTREGGSTSFYSQANYPVVDDGPNLSPWQMIMNRVMVSYILLSGGLSDVVLRSLIKIKNEVIEELDQCAREEVEAATDPQKARGEMAFLFGDTMLSRFDNITGRGLKARCIDMSPKAAV